MMSVSQYGAPLLDAELVAAILRLDDRALEALTGALFRFRDGQISGEQAVAEFGEYCRDRLKVDR